MGDQSVRVAMVGCGRMSREHITDMIQHPGTHIVVVCEPSPGAYDATKKIFEDAGLPAPPNQTDLTRLLQEYRDQLDAAFIVTPHVHHFGQASACLEAGLDVLLEKPMVMNADEAQHLDHLRSQSGKKLVVAFNGSLSSQVRMAASILHSGELGSIQTVDGSIWEGWVTAYAGHWKQNAAVAGGGFMFDCGAHLMNTICDLVGQEFTQVAAWLDNTNAPVDVNGVVIGRLESGALVTLNGCGATEDAIGSDIKVFCTRGIIRIGAWGEFLEIQRPGDDELKAVRPPTSPGVWEQFLAIRSSQIENPSSTENGKRMAKLWDAIQLSAMQHGAVVNL